MATKKKTKMKTIEISKIPNRGASRLVCGCLSRSQDQKDARFRDLHAGKNLSLTPFLQTKPTVYLSTLQPSAADLIQHAMMTIFKKRLLTALAVLYVFLKSTLMTRSSSSSQYVETSSTT